ncbi:prepilin peptidase [Paenisporosarcina cavernae]|uniref:Prepilin peptidase n=1 Tax=Paenisporosarcina cavernae TaxID=2320858 RepID=A0A385YTW2_9BACL|nr:A24 family peptidase [Paenisporosarcina cavernae]AYC29750.1 prepilin peptidase [Paenisporosarcina cavernae]
MSILFFLYGLIFGSFYNVVGLRVPNDESIVHPPSTCPTCKHRLTWKDLVPVFSYMFLGGKCRHCKTSIPIFYPLMELLTGILFVYAYLQEGFSGELIVALLYVSLFVIITVSDLVYMIIPDKVLIILGLMLLAGRIISPLDPWWESLAGAIIGFFLLWLIAIVSKGGMGGGDVKLFLLIGLVSGSKGVLMTLFIASFIGAFIGVISILLFHQDRKTPIPFGPFIAIGALIVYFHGNQLLESYLNLFF